MRTVIRLYACTCEVENVWSAVVIPISVRGPAVRYLDGQLPMLHIHLLRSYGKTVKLGNSREKQPFQRWVTFYLMQELRYTIVFRTTHSEVVGIGAFKALSRSPRYRLR